jgi:hypothetical protein
VLGWTTLHHSAGSLAHAQSAGCSNATLTGSYGTVAWGTTLLGADSAPLAAPCRGLDRNVGVLVAGGARAFALTADAARVVSAIWERQ